MNVRDRLVPHKDEDSYIRFDLNDDNADCEINCTNHELAGWLANIVNISLKIMKDNFKEDIQKKIISKRASDLEDLLLDDKE
jgi:hypothetical protein